jgi:hypothetical protein
VDITPPGFHGAISCSSSALRAMLKTNGDKMPPYEQCGIMRSVVLMSLVRAMTGIDRCA